MNLSINSKINLIIFSYYELEYMISHNFPFFMAFKWEVALFKKNNMHTIKSIQKLECFIRIAWSFNPSLGNSLTHKIKKLKVQRKDILKSFKLVF